MHRPELKRLPAGLLGILFFLILVCTYAAMFMVERRSEKAIVKLQQTFASSYIGVQEARIASLVNQQAGLMRITEAEEMNAAIRQFINLSSIQWVSQQENPAELLSKAWQDWLEASTRHSNPEPESIQLLNAIILAVEQLEELKIRTTDAFDLIIFLSGVLFSLGTSGSIAFYSRLRQSRLKEEFAAANLKKALESEDAIRRTIAIELHDDIAQDIAAARMLCERMHHTEIGDSALASRAARTLGEVNQKIRILCTDLRPPALEQTGLAEAVRALCETESHRLSHSLRFLPQGEIPRLPAEVEANLYRIIREAVVNASKHALEGAIDVRSRVSRTESSQSLLIIEIQDIGFEQSVNNSTRGFGFGITTMQERANLIGADLTVLLDPAGSLVRIVLPLG